MDRRAFLFSTAWLSVAPASNLLQAPGRGDEYAGASLEQAGVFDAWRAAFIPKAVAAGLGETEVRAALAGVTPDPHVIVLDQRQPEFSRPISGYLQSTTSPDRVADGRSHMAAARPWLDPIVELYQTQGEVLVAIWAVESAFGVSQGDDDVIRSMATLAAEGRRRAFAEDELVGALRILSSGEATRSQLKGSWAGAMGQTQFTPLDYLTYAVDADGDGRRDIWGSSADALGSSANFLVKKAHWRPHESTQAEVVVPRSGFDYGLIEGPSKLPAEWAALGVIRADHGQFAAADQAAPATLLMPMGWQGPGFLAFPNHMAIRAYNNSTSYALAVGLLADRIGGGEPMVQTWPLDQPISLADRVAAQQALTSLGLYAGQADGLLGTATRKAARLWQSSQGLPADGYLSFALIQRLKTQVGVAPVSMPTSPISPAAPAS
jgi:lytic murein transglycosylase